MEAIASENKHMSNKNKKENAIEIKYSIILGSNIKETKGY